MTELNSTVVVIEDDVSVRESLANLFRSVGLDVQLFSSGSEFLKSGRPESPACLVLDVRLPDASGLDVQRELAAAEIRVPVIFITGYGDIHMSVQAMKGGAIEFLTKPFREQDLIDAVQLGLARDRAQRDDEQRLVTLKERFASLTPREREIMHHVAQGRLNKQIAFDMNISEITVKVHRGQVMRKMNATSLPELTRMADRLANAGIRFETAP
ncbi:MAG: response regulator transcription factor [Pseudomonadota bacterium]|nr:response regulator transcription factor [Pseudomonadota bacterium]